MEIFINNIKWIFSGIGIVALKLIASIKKNDSQNLHRLENIFSKRFERKNKIQQKSGNYSKNINILENFSTDVSTTVNNVKQKSGINSSNINIFRNNSQNNKI